MDMNTEQASKRAMWPPKLCEKVKAEVRVGSEQRAHRWEAPGYW